MTMQERNPFKGTVRQPVLSPESINDMSGIRRGRILSALRDCEKKLENVTGYILGQKGDMDVIGNSFTIKILTDKKGITNITLKDYKGVRQVYVRSK